MDDMQVTNEKQAIVDSLCAMAAELDFIATERSGPLTTPEILRINGIRSMVESLILDMTDGE